MRGYVGIPFVDGGRGMDGCDCWGLLRLVYQREAGIELPSYGEISAAEVIAVARQIRSAITMDPWIDVAAQPRREFDCVVMRKLEEAQRVPYHVGVMVSSTRLLHTVYAADSHTVDTSDPSVARRIIGFYRHKDLP
jgi:cell wall-associated NlpC family hydrolase